MEELFYGLIALALVIAPFWALIANIRKTSRLERDLWILRQRFDIVEKKILPSSESSAEAASKTIPAHQLATLIDLETLRAETLRTEAQSHSAQSSFTEAPFTEAPSENVSETPISTSNVAPNPINEAAQEPLLQDTPMPKSPQKPQKTNTEWEALIGGQLFNRIGAAAIVIGMGFFLKYAFDNDLISEPVRVFIGLLAGMVLLFFGERLQTKKLPLFAQGLTGAGIGTLYLSVYAAYNFYHLVPVFQAFAGMIGVTAIGFVLALRYNALSIALLSWFGGYLTPLLIHSEQPNPFGLMSYLTVLTLGMLLLVLRRDDWFVLKPLSFLATYAVCGVWYANAYTTMEHFSMTTGFAVLFWAMYFGVDFYRAVSGRSITDVWWWRIDSFLNSSLSYAALFALIYDAHPRWMPLASLCYGGVYFLAGQSIRLRKPEHTFAFMRYTLTAIVQMVLATAQQFNDEHTLMLWGVEFVLLLWAAQRWKHGFVGFAGIVVSIVTFIAFWELQGRTGAYPPKADFIGLRGQLHLVLAIAYFCAAFLEERLIAEGTWDNFFLRKYLRDSVSSSYSILRLCFALSAVFFFIYEFDQYKLWSESQQMKHEPYWYRMACSAAYAVVALFLAWIAKWRSWREPVWVGTVLLLLFTATLIVSGFAYEPASEWSLLLNVRVISLLLALVVVIAFWRVFDETNATLPEKIRPYIRPALGGIAFLLMFSLLSGEASDASHSQIMRLYALPEAIQQSATITDKIAALENAKQLSLSLVWLVYAAVIMAVGFVQRLRVVRLVALGLAGIAILKIFLYDLSFLTTPYRIGSFIGLGVVLLLVSYLYQRFKDRII